MTYRYDEARKRHENELKNLRLQHAKELAALEKPQEVDLCIATMCTGNDLSFPIEIMFPAGTKERHQEFCDALENAVKELGFVTRWIPIL